MNPFHLISRSALHIFSCRRLLAWNLLTCCICISCITEVKYGYTDIQNKKEETSSDIAKVCKKSEATELHFACAHRDLKQVRKLLSKGADPNVQDPSGCTPFQLAILHFIKKVKKRRLIKPNWIFCPITKRISGKKHYPNLPDDIKYATTPLRSFRRC